MMKKTFGKSGLLMAFAFLMSFAARAQSADAITGIWWNAEKTAKIKVYENKGKYFGKIVHLETPNDEMGNPKTDIKNPNTKLKTRPRLGLVILEDLAHKGDGVYEDGEVYDPESGKTYSAEAELQGTNKLGLRGYVGFSLFGKTSTWTRAE